MARDNVNSANGPDRYGTFNEEHVAQTRAKRNRYWRMASVAGLVILAAGFVLLSHKSEQPAAVTSTKATPSVAEASALEQKYIASIEPKKLREFLHAYATIPHPAGTKQDYETAVYTAKQFEVFGLNATIKEYVTLLSNPVRRRLAIVAPQNAARELNLTEASVEGDECTTRDDALPPFLAYSGSGNVTASVVYCNFGTQADFQWLVDHNVSLVGKIALIRYGGNFRGLKVMAAEQHDMKGVLIYSDPHEDGFVKGETYPHGIYRPARSFQRGSAQYLSIAGGDPLTPGFPSVPGAPYLTVEEANSIPHIPALPLSYEQANYILQSLGGTEAPATWQGGLAINGGYRVGNDEVTVLNLDLVMDNKIGPIWDVIGTIEGSEEPDQQVIIGNHRDAWVCGAVDPSSGSAVMLEIARGLGGLLKDGWKPRRTIVLGSWDGEEYGLLGSTEWAEDNAEVLQKQAVAYINVDNVVGPLVLATGTPSIAEFLFQTAKDVPANKFFGNETESSLYEQWIKQNDARRAKIPAGVSDGTLAPDHLIGFMGSGSDFTAFYQHLGVISANLGYTLNGEVYGVYHSTMDSLMYMETLGDPQYETHASMAKWWGLLTIRLANDLVIPFDFSTYGLVMREDLVAFEAKIAAMKRDVDFAKLHDAIQQFTDNTNKFHASINALNTTENATSEATRLALNKKLVNLERYLLTEDGLPHRPWYKHVIFGPGFYQGYMGTAFPGIDDAIAFGDNSTTIQTHVDDVARVITNAAEFLLSA
ncbi:Glutamate carboxypeptidase, partial [Globisporangium splendens]